MWQRPLGMCVVFLYAQLLYNQLWPAQGVLHLTLFLQEAKVCLALALLQLSVQCRLRRRLRHIGCNLQAINKTLSLASWEQSGWLAQIHLHLGQVWTLHRMHC